MAATKEVLELTAKIFEESYVGLDESFTERVRHLGDASCKAGIQAVIEYLSGKSELSETELEMRSGGDIPEDHKLSSFEDHIEQLPRNAAIEPNEREKSVCQDAFDSRLAAGILYLMKAAKLDNAGLLSVIPSASET
jgi:hypothetical protein